MMKNPKNKQIHITLSVGLSQMLDDIVGDNDRGYTTTSEVVREAIRNFHAKLFPNYLYKGKTPETVQDRVQKRFDKKAERKEYAMRRCTDVLDGEIIEGRCRVTRYSDKNGEQVFSGYEWFDLDILANN